MAYSYELVDRDQLVVCALPELLGCKKVRAAEVAAKLVTGP